jgi:hypothetical protein
MIIGSQNGRSHNDESTGQATHVSWFDSRLGQMIFLSVESARAGSLLGVTVVWM